MRPRPVAPPAVARWRRRGPIGKRSGNGGLVVLAVDDEEPEEIVPVELAGRTTLVSRSDVRFVEARGDYARLHTEDTTHLVRISLPPWPSGGATRAGCGSTAPTWSRPTG